LSGFQETKPISDPEKKPEPKTQRNNSISNVSIFLRLIYMPRRAGFGFFDF